jgi:hypothetical protein
MRYTKPTILNESKAMPVIMGQNKGSDAIDQTLPFVKRTADVAAYEADE